MCRQLPALHPSTRRTGLLALVRAGVLTGILAGMSLIAGIGASATASAAIAPPTDAPKAEIQRMLVEEALIDGTVPPSLALAVARVESNFDADVVSHAGAIGVMQIMPATARSEFGVPAHRLTDARLNSRMGVAFLHRLYTAYGRRWDLALSHYNGGSLRKVGGVWVAHSYTRDYVTKVMGFWNEFQRERWVQALIVEAGHGSTALAEVTPTPDAAPVPPRTVHEQMAEDYAYLEDPMIDRDWRDYLNVADRWLNADGGVPAPRVAEEDESVDFSTAAAGDPNWNYPLVEPVTPSRTTDTQRGGAQPGPGHTAPTSTRPSTMAYAGRMPGPTTGPTSTPSTRDRLKGAERFIYSSEFWKHQTPGARFN